MIVHGRCHCGEIAYEADVDPERAGICHCTDCQMLSGSAYRVAVLADRDSFSITRGHPKIYVKTAESGNRRAHAFCSNCGTPVYSSAVTDPPTYALRVGCLDQRAELAPKRQIWCASAVPWSSDLSALPKISGQPPA
ncbi:MAG TPA: GFA family protein [Candidatus Limnocylindrales bacterium]|nr:GFA family protein [Candidatus Limnocylindrales bacterium]